MDLRMRFHYVYVLIRRNSPFRKVKIKSFENWEIELNNLKRYLKCRCMILFDSMDCNLPDCSIHGIFQERILECVVISFLQGIFPIQGSNPGVPHCRQTLYHLSYQGSPVGKKLALNCRRTIILKRKK